MNTIEMIQQLGHGMKARSTNWGIEVTYDSGDILVTKNDDGTRAMSRKPLPLTNLVLNQMVWKFIPNAITFEKAVSFIGEGKVVTLLSKDMVTFHFNSLDQLVTFREVMNGKWYEGKHELEDLQ